MPLTLYIQAHILLGTARRDWGATATEPVITASNHVKPSKPWNVDLALLFHDLQFMRSLPEAR